MGGLQTTTREGLLFSKSDNSNKQGGWRSGAREPRAGGGGGGAEQQPGGLLLFDSMGGEQEQGGCSSKAREWEGEQQ